MKRVTQSTAADAAKRMRQKYWDQKVLAAGNAAAASIMKVIDRYIPSSMRQTMDVYETLFGNGITKQPTLYARNRRTLYLPIQLQKKYPMNITVEDADHDRIKDILDDFNSVRDQAHQYEKAVETTLLQLKYQGKIQQAFPEALEFIEWGETADEKQAKVTIAELRKQMK